MYTPVSMTTSEPEINTLSTISAVLLTRDSARRRFRDFPATVLSYTAC